jgi:hypothetical protein
MTIASRWDELTVKSDTVSDLSCRDALQLLAAPPTNTEPKAQRVADLPAVQLPELRPGHGYMGDGHSPRFGKCWAAIDPHPNHPGFWVYLFDFGCEEGWGFTEYCGRGVRLDQEMLAKIMERKGFIPDGPWEETEPDPEPSAIGWYRETLRRVMA